MAYDPFNDPELDAIKSRIDAAANDDAAEQLAADIGARRDADEHPIRRFALNAPKNIGIGAWKALVNTVDTLSDVASKTGPNALAAQVAGGDELRQQLQPSLSEQHPEFMNSLRNFTSEWERNDTLSDDITQGTAQFAIPFMGWLKAAGGVGKLSTAATVGKFAAVEGVTAASAFEPQENRVADLLEMGRESETRFGMLLRQIAPDDSLVNQYIDYMTDRSDEGAWEGRWKNAVDAVVSSAALGAVLKTAAGSFKFGKFLLDDAGVSSFGPKGQRGHIGSRTKSAPDDEVLENVQEQIVPDEFVMPGSTVLKSADGFIAMTPGSQGVQINRAKVKPEAQGQGQGKELLLKAAAYAEKKGLPLSSDDTVTVAQLRVYESLAKQGKITFTYSNPEAVSQALAAGDARMPVKAGGGKPVVKNIKLVQEKSGG